MADTDPWIRPPDHRVWGSGDATITLVLPPFPDRSEGFPAHDPAAARRFAEDFGTIDAVLEELTPLSPVDPVVLETRTDLDVVRVGCWGNVIALADPALADNGDAHPVREQVRALAERYPGARIVGSAHVDTGETHAEDAVVVPGAPALHSAGWSGEEPWTLTGDVWAVLDALGITPEAVEEEDVEIDEDPRFTEWEGVSRLAQGPCRPWGRKELRMSVFRVRHTEAATRRMEEIWLPEG
ncbi:DUF6333 family protein [Streptomyces sp. NPDC008121]|uniref:DUF6333 family protein n=1 Tax=Streptomyces sp. NPDC008121 TaxID=3364809 RepID=UPI0036E99CD5